MLPFLFPQIIGATRDSQFPLQAISAHTKFIPSTWKEYVEEGLVRIQANGLDCRIWFPHKFLLDLMLPLVKWFNVRASVQDVAFSAITNYDLCLQHAVALDLLLDSKLVKNIIKILKKEFEVNFSFVKLK